MIEVLHQMFLETLHHRILMEATVVVMESSCD
jgi:hypothetical protein